MARYDQNGVSDSKLAELLSGYKRGVASRYLAATADEIDKFVGKASVHVSKKIDGQTWFAVLDGDNSFFANPRGRVIAGDHPLVDELREHAKAVDTLQVIAGELYALSDSGRSRCGDIAAALGGANKADAARMRFAAFDVCTFENGPAAGATDEALQPPVVRFESPTAGRSSESGVGCCAASEALALTVVVTRQGKRGAIASISTTSSAFCQVFEKRASSH